MLTIAPAALGALAVQLAKVDATQQVLTAAIDALEAAANACREPERLGCLQALRVADEEYNDALFDMAEAVREALYGLDEEDEG